MWKKGVPDNYESLNYRTDDYKELLRYINLLASHKLGYPVSLLTYIGIIDNQILGINPGSLANVLLNNVGDPFKDSETSLLEVKKHEREIIRILENFYGAENDSLRGYVTTGGTEGNFAGLWWSKRYLINMALDMLIAKDNSIKLQTKELQDLMTTLNKMPYSDYELRSSHFQKIIQVNNSINNDKNTVQQLLTPTVFYAKGSTHYSVPKVSEILRLNVKPVLANDDGSINLNDLEKQILIHQGAYPLSPVIVVANIGTTITGAIDDIPGIKRILDQVEPKLNYTIHMDGALTGFVLPIIKPFGEIKNYFASLGVNTLAVSAHKYPGLSQPCGIILATKNFFQKAFEKSERSIEYVGNIVDITITGSRSGLNVLMFYNALITLGLDKDVSVLKKMVNLNIKNAKYLYDCLVKIYGYENVYYPYHFNVMFPKPSTFLTKKYQLMLTGNKATICVLTNVTKDLIDQFVMDLLLDKETTMTEITTTQTDYTVQPLEDQHVNSVVDLFVKSFCDSEPITKYIGMRYQEYEPFAREVVLKAVKEGLSKVALDKQKKVIACAIADDMADPFIPHLSHYPKMAPIIQLIDTLSQPFTQGKKFNKGKVIHIYISAVDPAYRGQGLSTAIEMACVENAARKGYDFAYAEFTSDLTENVTKQFKIVKLYNRIMFNDFVTNDHTKPFAGLKGSASAYLATIRPGINLNSLANCYQESGH